MRLRRPLGPAAVLLVLAASAPALATGGDVWPGLGHDAGRTARSDGAGAIANTPALAWKLPVGGALAESQLGAADVDGDGDREAVLVAAGRVVARRADDTEVWQSPNIGALRVIGVYDLDGVAPAEVVAIGQSPVGLYILSAATGAQLWYEPTNTTAIDALAVPSGSGYRLELARQLGALSSYQFAGGVLDPAQNLAWTDASAPWSVDMVGADVDADGQLDLVRGRDRGFVVHDAATGAVKCQASNLIGNTIAPTYFPALAAADVNGDGRAEVILYDYSYYYSEDAGVFVVSCAGAGPVLAPQLLWSQQWITDVTPGPGNDVNQRQIRWLADGVADLDGQGPAELVYSLWDASAGAWTTFVRNAATGAVIASKAGEIVESVADLDADGAAEVLMRESTDVGAGIPKPFFSTMRLYDLQGAALVDKGWAIPEARAATVSGRRAAVVTGGAGAIGARQNTNGAADAPDEAYVFLKDNLSNITDPRPGKLVTVHGPDGVILHEYEFPDGISGSVHMLTSDVAGPGAQAESLVMLNDGGLRVLDKDLLEGSQIRPGNYAHLVSVASLDGVKNTLFAVDSADTLLAIDGTQLSGGKPVVAWRFVDASQPESRGYVNAPGLVLPEPNGTTARLVVRGHSAASYEEQALHALTATGQKAWSVDVGAGRQVPSFENFELLDDLDNDGTRDLFATELDPASEQELVVRSGATGALMVSRPVADLFPPNGVYLQGHATADLDGDGVLDVVSALHGSWFVGIDLSLAGTGDPALGFAQIFRAGAGPNGQAMVGDLDGDAALDLVRANSQNAFDPYERRDLATGAVEASYMSPHPAVALADANSAAFVARPGVPGKSDLVWSGMAGSALGALGRVDGATMAPAWLVYLKGGAVFPQASPPAGSAALYSPIAVDLDGDGDDEVVVGSDEGWLYALAASDASLAFSVQLGAPVVHVIAADIDKDPAVELVAALGDGTLVALDGPGLYDADDVTPPPPDAGPDGSSSGSSGGGGQGGASTGGGGQAGSGSTGGAGPTASTSSGAGGAGAGAATPASGDGGDDGGCGCRTAPARGRLALPLTLLLALAIAARRRRASR